MMLATPTPYLWTCRHPFLHITISFIIGMLTAYYTPLARNPLPYIAFGGIVLAYMLYTLYLHRSTALPGTTGLLGLLAIFLAGYLNLHTARPEANPYHLIHQKEPIEAYRGSLVSFVKKTASTDSVIIELQHARIQGVWQPMQGRVRLMSSCGELAALCYGDTILIVGAPAAPFCSVGGILFDYPGFLAKKKIYRTHFVHASQFRKLASLSDGHPYTTLLRAKRWLATCLQEHLKEASTCGVVLALTLGLRDQLPKKLQEMYITTGVIHVLAISGMHIGFLYCLLMLLLRLLGLHQRTTTNIGVLLLLWAYAWVTGLSASVLRAVTIVSLLLINNLLERKYSSTHTLALSAFLLTLYRPYFLFQPSFQLSYAAVLGILWLHPKLTSRIRMPAPLRSIGPLLTLSLSAQLATLPLTLYYFGRLPTYFLLGNLIALPMISLIVFLALLILLTSPLSMVSLALGKVTVHCMHLLHAFLHGLQHLPYSSIELGKLSLTTVFVLYSLVFLLWIVLRYRRLSHLLLWIGLILLLPLRHLYLQHLAPSSLFYYSHPTHSTLGTIINHRATLLTKSALPLASRELFVYLQQQGVHQADVRSLVSTAPSPLFASWQGIKLVALQQCTGLWIGEPFAMCIASSPPIAIDFLIVEHDALEGLADLLACFRPSLLILGATNSPPIMHRLEQEARGYHLPYITLSMASPVVVPLLVA